MPLTRRRFDRTWKRELIEQALRPGASVAKLARDNDLNTNQLFKWCRQHQRSMAQAVTPAALLPVVVREEAPQLAPATSSLVLTLQLTRGSMRFEGPLDIDLVRALVQTLATR